VIWYGPAYPAKCDLLLGRVMQLVEEKDGRMP
jgi:hypothetical protein